MTNTTPLLTQLNALLRLTQTEVMLAETRAGQATTDRFQRELSSNASEGTQRAQAIATAIRELGGAPDIVGAALGRVGAFAKTTLDQGQSLEEALLSDLALEHQLRDRAQFARMLAEQIPASKVVTLLDRLEAAHSSTIEWLMLRLGEVAVGGPAALRPSPLQAAVGVGRRLSQRPARQAAQTLNRSFLTVGQLQERAAGAVTVNVDRSRQLITAAADIWTAGRDASLLRTQEIASEKGSKDTARAVNRVRRNLGAVDQTELPIRNYDKLTVGVAVSRIDRLTDAEQVRTVLAYEGANKNRKGVLDAASNRIEVLAGDLVQVS